MAEKGKKMVEIRDRSNEELSGSLSRAKDELFRLKLGRFTNQLENVMQIRNKRREIARIMTVISAREHGHEPQKGAASNATGEE
jgi:large subunit ribosomal protein L29